MKTDASRIVLAYSGGLTSSVAIQWLAEKYHAEIVTMTLDIGQDGDVEEVRDRALAIGARRAHVLDVREELADEFITRAIKADATLDGYPLAVALGRPLIAKRLVEIATIEEAQSVAHGASTLSGLSGPLGATSDALRLNETIRSLSPNTVLLALAREWEMSRIDLVEYARTRNIALPSVERLRSVAVDATLWGRSVDCIGTDAWMEPPEELYRLTAAPANCPGEPAYAEIAFERGVPTAVNGVPMPAIELISTLTMIAGAHGVGRFDACGHTGSGVKTRQISEAPAAVVLHTAHAELQTLAIGKEATRFSRHVSRQYADLADSGLWFSSLRDALDAYVDKIQERVTGTIRLRFFKGDCRIVGRKLVGPRASAKKLRVLAAQTH